MSVLDSRFVQLPLNEDIVSNLHAGEHILLSGTVYTARDAAHKKIVEAIENSGELPFELENSTIYYTGPAPAPPGRPVGSAGPTTSYRMDSYTPVILKAGVRGLIGKGERCAEVALAIQKYKAVYFAAIGGAGALLSERIKFCEVIAYEELGTEAVHRLEYDNFPVIVAQDIYGGNVYGNNR
ncbi:MAG: TRZ/ATZ family protein [Chlamydiae bacterium]|nr:MAG: TRZ/ATZ family protein [Chlamydiota bacterium]